MIIVIIITNILDTLRKGTNQAILDSYFMKYLMLFILLPQLIGHNHIQINLSLYTAY